MPTTDVLGIRIFEKTFQAATAWMIFDQKVAKDYLSGRITETDLEVMAGKDAGCQTWPKKRPERHARLGHDMSNPSRHGRLGP